MNTGGQQHTACSSSISMHNKKSTGLLLITNLHSLLGVEQLLKASINHVKNRLYIALHDRVVEDLHKNRLNGLTSVIDFLCNCYRVAGLSTLSSTDVRVFLENVKDSKTGSSKLLEKLTRIDCVILDRPTNDSNFIDLSNGTSNTTGSSSTNCSGGSTSSLYKKLLSAELRYLNLTTPPASTLHQQQRPHFKMDEFKVCLHNGVVLGGTFDRLHNGHKFLLSTSALLAKCYLTCGVTDGVMLENKLLYELMEPIERRIEAVREFVEDVDSSLTYKIVPIYDPFGPSTVDTNLQGIVVSKETLRGAVKVNEGRAKNNLNQLKIHVIDLLDDDVKDEETKISSSKLRKKLLGKLIREPKVKSDNIPSPYILGLSGGICSGKTHIAQYLEEFGAHVIDCDKLGHQAYAVGTRAYQKIIEEFGNDVIDKQNNNAINRKVLGAKVFTDKQKLEKLNAIVWPEIERLAKEQISLAARNKKRVVVLDAAVLLEAGWDSVVHEIWVPIIPIKEAVKRLKERNKLTEEEAVQRVKSQLSNSDRVKKAHVVFCSLWDYTVTKAQIKFAWTELQRRISSTNNKDKDSVSSSSSFTKN